MYTRTGQSMPVVGNVSTGHNIGMAHGFRATKKLYQVSIRLTAINTSNGGCNMQDIQNVESGPQN